MSEIVQNLPQAANDNGVPKSELEAHFEKQIQKPRVKAELKTTVSRLAIILPQFFMSEKDPGRMIKMLEQTRKAIWDVGKFEEGTPLAKQNFAAANDNSTPNNAPQKQQAA